jgi:hypothetical protein
MANPKEPVRIKLTAEQKEMIRKATGMKAEALELTPEDLEQRIAPSTLRPKK